MENQTKKKKRYLAILCSIQKIIFPFRSLNSPHPISIHFPFFINRFSIKNSKKKSSSIFPVLYPPQRHFRNCNGHQTLCKIDRWNWNEKILLWISNYRSETYILTSCKVSWHQCLNNWKVFLIFRIVLRLVTVHLS